MQSEFHGDDFLFECPVSTCTPHLIQNSVELQIVNDLEDRYRLRYQSESYSKNGHFRCSRYVGDRQGNHYVTLKMTPNVQGKIRVDWVTLPDRTGRRYIMPYHFLVTKNSSEISFCNPIMQDIEMDSNGFIKLYLVLTKANHNALSQSQPLVPFQPAKDALHNSNILYHTQMSPKELIRKFQLNKFQLAFTLYTTTDGILFFPQSHTTVFSTVITEGLYEIFRDPLSAKYYRHILSSSINTYEDCEQKLSMVEGTTELSKRQKFDGTILENSIESIINTSLLALPVEIVHHIFDYCDVKTIFSTRCVCKRMYACADTYNRFKLTFKSTSPSTVESTFRLIQPERVISLTVYHTDDIKDLGFDQIHPFYSLFINLQFTRLCSFTFRGVSDIASRYVARNFLNANCLESVSIELREGTYEKTWVSNLSTFSQCNIRKLCLNNIQTMREHISWPDQWKLQYLAINDCTYNVYLLILRQLPHLRTFSMRNLITDNAYIQTLSASNSTFTTVLESLTMTHCSLLPYCLELLLSLTPSLRQLKLVSHREVFDSFFDATHWEKFITIKLPKLQKFEFIFFHTYHENNDSINVDVLTAPFRSSFWLDEKQWFIAGAYVLEENEIWLYTTPIEFVHVRNFFRLEASCVDNSYCLTERPLYKMPDPSSDKTPAILDLHLHPTRNQMMQHLLNALSISTTLIELNLGGIQLGNQGTMDIVHALQNNKTLEKLWLWQNQIGHEGAQYLTNLLYNNTTLKELYLGNNQIGDQGAQYFAHVLQNNTTLTTLDLRANKIGKQGIKDLANGLENNKTIIALGLEYNLIGDQEAQYLLTALMSNRTLQHLYLSKNYISADVWNQFLKKDN